MTIAWQRTVAIFLLGLLGAGILVILYFMVQADGQLTVGDGGGIAAAYLSLREVFSKIEKIALGDDAPAGEAA